jgi:hypothetical protein
MKTIYTQRSREDGQQQWREGSDASELFICIDNIMETIAQKHKPSDAAWSDCFTALMQSGRCVIDGTTYEITQREEEEEGEDQ